jgi:hypothetical protein
LKKEGESVGPSPCPESTQYEKTRRRTKGPQKHRFFQGRLVARNVENVFNRLFPNTAKAVQSAQSRKAK